MWNRGIIVNLVLGLVRSAHGAPTTPRSLFTLAVMAGTLLVVVTPSSGQQPDAGPRTSAGDVEMSEAEQRYAEAIGDKGAPTGTEAGGPDARFNADRSRISLRELFTLGGWLMWPIVVVSIVVVIFAVERFLALRTSRVIPRGLVRELGEISAEPGEFDPRAAYRICQKFPSAAAAIIRAMLLKVGRPHAEVEATVNQASQREANRLYANVRPIQLGAAISPLLGLLGTVWGMIEAFFTTANLPPGANRIDFLAQGIYTALVTTFGGLCVAIPAAITAHYLEGKIQRLFLRIDELMLTLLPHVERYEGKLRVGRRELSVGGGRAAKPAAEEPVSQAADANT